MLLVIETGASLRGRVDPPGPARLTLQASAGGSLTPGTYWVKIATLKGGDISSIDLCPTRDPGQNTVSPVLLGRVVWKIFHQQRSWSNQRHFTAHDVPQLWEFIEASPA